MNFYAFKKRDFIIPKNLDIIKGENQESFSKKVRDLFNNYNLLFKSIFEAIKNYEITDPSYLSAWTAYTPTVTAQTGSFTTVNATGKYIEIGKIVHFNYEITLTNIGTATGYVRITLPKTPKDSYFPCLSVISYPYLGAAYVSRGYIYMWKYDQNTAILGNGIKLYVSGTYEQE